MWKNFIVWSYQLSKVCDHRNWVRLRFGTRTGRKTITCWQWAGNYTYISEKNIKLLQPFDKPRRWASVEAAWPSMLGSTFFGFVLSTTTKTAEWLRWAALLHSLKTQNKIAAEAMFEPLSQQRTTTQTLLKRHVTCSCWVLTFIPDWFMQQHVEHNELSHKRQNTNTEIDKWPFSIVTWNSRTLCKSWLTCQREKIWGHVAPCNNLPWCWMEIVHLHSATVLYLRWPFLITATVFSLIQASFHCFGKIAWILTDS